VYFGCKGSNLMAKMPIILNKFVSLQSKEQNYFVLPIKNLKL